MTLLSFLPQDTPQFLASKWIHLHFLVDPSELRKLFEIFGSPVFIFSAMGPKKKGENQISVNQFEEVYGRYIDTLKTSKIVNDKDFRFTFSAYLTNNLDALISIDLGEREMISPRLPIIQIKIHRFQFSKIDNKFRSMALSKETISWGLQLSYPQLFQDPEERITYNALNKEQFSNALLLQKAKEWLRTYTIPTPFIINESRCNAPFRLGKKCFSWISEHKELSLNGLTIFEFKEKNEN